MRLFFFAISLFFTHILFACECPVLEPISKDNISRYDIVFDGRVDSVSTCDSVGLAQVYFTINELYKGSVYCTLSLNFDCSSECLMSFTKGEEWLIYASYKKFDFLAINLCSHSRKHFDNDAEDFYMMAAQRTFAEEKQFLKENMSAAACLSEENAVLETDIGMHNKQPSGLNKILLLIISLAAMVVVYIVTKKKK